nr:MAG TPA: hypothetical protein [Caudoviricetes sp.]
MVKQLILRFIYRINYILICRKLDKRTEYLSHPRIDYKYDEYL